MLRTACSIKVIVSGSTQPWGQRPGLLHIHEFLALDEWMDEWMDGHKYRTFPAHVSQSCQFGGLV
jgi:hypothetical protein